MRQRMSQSRVSQEQGMLTRIARFFSQQAVKVTLLAGLTLALASLVAPPSTAVSTGTMSSVIHPRPWCGNSSGWC